MRRRARRLTVVTPYTEIGINEQNVVCVRESFAHHEIKQGTRSLTPVVNDILDSTLIGDTLKSSLDLGMLFEQFAHITLFERYCVARYRRRDSSASWGWFLF
jgi:hypothetical protein